MESSKNYDVVVVGGGVSGTSLANVAAKYTDIASVALFEKNEELGQVNSESHMNSQTLHFGDIETNYTIQKATKVKRTADMLKNFLNTAKATGENELFTVYNKMVIAVGSQEVSQLTDRYSAFHELYPHLELIDGERIAELEPKVMEGRDKNQAIKALYSPEGYTVDFGLLSQYFVKDALQTLKETKDSQERILDVFTGTSLKSITRSENGEWNIETTAGEKIRARAVVVSAGGYTPVIAQSLGYWKDLSVLSIAGSFYKSDRKLLEGKVYTMQNPKLPFAAIHGDPDVHNANETRFGPTAKGIPQLERYNWGSTRDYFKVFGINRKSFAAFFQIVKDKTIRNYLLKNFSYDLPLIGKWLFLKEVKKIVPTATYSDIEYAEHTGGTRPQIMNTTNKSLDLGEARIVGENGDKIIFNITPSPGASTCIGNAENDILQIMKFFDGEYHFDQEAFNKDLVK